MRSRAVELAGPVTEKFAVPSGRALGYVAVGMGVVLAAGAVSQGVADHWRLALLGAALAMLSWAVMIRPAVAAHEQGLLMFNVLHDVYVPWGSVERCKALQTLQVATPDGIVHGLAVGRSARALIRQETGTSSVIGSMLGFGGGGSGRSLPSSQPTGFANEEVRSGVSYADYVESRILDMARDSHGEPRPVVRSLAPAPTAALAGALVLVLVALVSMI